MENNEENLGIKASSESQKTGWESLAALAGFKNAEQEAEVDSFDKAAKECQEQMYELDKKTLTSRKSDFDQTFRGFLKTCHEKTAECVRTAASRAEKLTEDDDPEIEVLSKTRRAGIAGGRVASDGELGTGEYIFEVLGSKCTPNNIGRLVLISKTIPSSDLARFESMRLDACRIENVVIAGRSFIHDCAPEAHRLIDAMVDYYDAKDDPEKVEAKRLELANLLLELRSKHRAGYKDAHEEKIFDLENYDKIVTKPLEDGAGGYSSSEDGAQIYNGEQKEETKAIDVLRQLKKNMEPVPLATPKTKIPELNEAFEQLGQVSVDERTGEIQVSMSDLTKVMEAINKHLINNQGERTLYPSTISAIAYIDRLAMAAIKNMSAKDRREAAFDPTFKEILRFSQLTMSGGYSENEFEGFYSKFMRQASEAYEEDGIDDDKITEAYRMLSFRSVKNAEAVAREFRGNLGLNYLIPAIWSGNLTHELIGLADGQSEVSIKDIDIGVDEMVANLDPLAIDRRIDTLLELGADVNQIVSKLGPAYTASNIDILIEHGLKIDVNELFKKLTPNQLEANLPKLLKNGASVDELVTTLTPAAIAKNLDVLTEYNAKIDIDQLTSNLTPDQVINNLDTLFKHGAKIDINNLVAQVNRFAISGNLLTLLKYGADINQIVSRLSNGTIIDNLETLLEHGANIDINELVNKLTRSEAIKYGEKLIRYGISPERIAERAKRPEDDE